jgi:hypothetical protein
MQHLHVAQILQSRQQGLRTAVRVAADLNSARACRSSRRMLQRVSEVRRALRVSCPSTQTGCYASNSAFVRGAVRPALRPVPGPAGRDDWCSVVFFFDLVNGFGEVRNDQAWLRICAPTSRSCAKSVPNLADLAAARQFHVRDFIDAGGLPNGLHRFVDPVRLARERAAYLGELSSAGN